MNLYLRKSERTNFGVTTSTVYPWLNNHLTSKILKKIPLWQTNKIPGLKTLKLPTMLLKTRWLTIIWTSTNLRFHNLFIFFKKKMCENLNIRHIIMLYRAHCSYLDVYISQNIMLCEGVNIQIATVHRGVNDGCCRVREARFYIYPSTKIAEAGPGFDQCL